MTPLRFEHIAHQAIATAFVLCIAQVETPEHRHLARVSSHYLEERPHQHAETDVEEYQNHSRIHICYQDNH